MVDMQNWDHQLNEAHKGTKIRVHLLLGPNSVFPFDTSGFDKCSLLGFEPAFGLRPRFRLGVVPSGISLNMWCVSGSPFNLRRFGLPTGNF